MSTVNPPDIVRRPVVLVADDAPECRAMLGEILQDFCTVRVASSGRRALELAMQAPIPDLMLLDVLMPDMDGHEVLAALREDSRTRDIPAIFVTSLHGDSDELKGLALGAADYIAKPASPLVVRARVRTQLELKRMRDHERANIQSLQDEIARRQHLEQRLHITVADLEAFTYSVSHDLRAPLAAIHSFAMWLREAEGASLSDDGRRRLDRIVAGAERMDSMIGEILACSRAERVGMSLQPVALDRLAAEVAEECRQNYPAARIDIAPLPQVRCDASMLRQVFANLIGNALKFSVGCKAPRVEIAAKALDEGDVEISVRDNGAGFDMAYAHKLFGLFQRLHSEAEFPGTGVGLAIVKRLVNRHGGKVRAESVPGTGTTFSFTLAP
jgi:two-component system, sensor histidine kinase and response regulator